MVGQYQGPEGTAALAVVAPLWNIIYSLGLLVGIGGSVLFSARAWQRPRGRQRKPVFYRSGHRRGDTGCLGLGGDMVL